MNRADSEKTKVPNAFIEERRTLTLSNIEDIVSFDESFVLLDFSGGRVSVEGEGLRIMKMEIDSGEVIVTGKINSLVFVDKKPITSGFGKLFRGGKKD